MKDNAEGVFTERQDDQPAVFHITHWKAGSQWVYAVLGEVAPTRIVLPDPHMSQFLAQPILPGMIYPTLYLTRGEFERVQLPAPNAPFVVIRDLRDTLVSWYFSRMYSHVPMGYPVDRLRVALEARSREDGLRYVMRRVLDRIALIQMSWASSNVLILRYEDFVENALAAFQNTLDHCQIEVSPDRLSEIVRRQSFESRSGRAPGEEDQYSHFRKGVVGDWKNYLSGELLAEFTDRYSDVLAATGYCTNFGRQGSLTGSRISLPDQTDDEHVPEAEKPSNATCWCGSATALPFSRDYDRCASCGTLLLSSQARNEARSVHDDRHCNLLADSSDGRAVSDLSDLVFSGPIDFLRDVLRYRRPGAKLLAVSSGSRTSVELLRAAGFEVTEAAPPSSVSSSDAMVEENAVQSGDDDQGHAVALDFQNFLPSSFDTVVIDRALNCVVDPSATLRWVLTLTKPDGLLLVRDDSLAPEGAFEKLRDSGSPALSFLKPDRHWRLFTAPGLARLIRQAGFAWVEQESRRRYEAPEAPWSREVVTLACARSQLPRLSDADFVPALEQTTGGRNALIVFALQAQLRGRDARLRTQQTEGQDHLVRVLEDSKRELEDRDRRASFLAREVAALQDEVADRQGEVAGLVANLEALSAQMDRHQNELVAKEIAIQGLLRFRSSSLRYWLLARPRVMLQRGRLRKTALPGGRLPRLRSWGRRASGLGILEQYPARPIKLPRRYRSPRGLSESLPPITVLTPTLNQAGFLERTMRSVIDQQYPNLEYVIQDGSSTDGTQEILERYRSRVARIDSRTDKNHSNAINLGFRHTSGDIMAYLNSDDLLLPGSLEYVGRYFAAHPEVDVVYGHRIIIDENDMEIGRWVLPPHDDDVLSWADYVPQETLFWRRDIWEAAGGQIDESFLFSMDWDLILRFRDAGARFVRLPRFLGAFRVHGQQKTSTTMMSVGEDEMFRLRERCLGRPVTYPEAHAHVRGYHLRHILYDQLYRRGVLRY